MSAIRRVPKKKRSQSARAFRPAPWNAKTEEPPHGLRHFNASWLGSEDLAAAERRAVTPPAHTRLAATSDRGLRTGPYSNDLWTGDHLRPNQPAEKPNKPMKKHNARINISTEQADILDTSRLEGRSSSNRPADHAEIPWVAPNVPRYLQTENGKPRGQRHALDHLSSNVSIPHSQVVTPKPRRTPGKVLSHDAKVLSCFEQGTRVRAGCYTPAAEHRARPPFGTADNHIPHESIRKYTVHFDTRELLTYC